MTCYTLSQPVVDKIMSEVGGYDYEMVTGQPPNDYICLICTLIAREAYQASCCGKVFCKYCLEQLFRNNSNHSCPNCRQNLNGKCFPDRRAIREISLLQVKCSNADKGCDWTGKLREAAHHERSACYQDCSNGCGARIRTGEMDHHLSQCPLQKIACPYCSWEAERSTVEGSHQDECPEISIPCPNIGCRRLVARKEVSFHRQVCPKEKVDCPYSSVGCTRACLRDCMPSHEEDYVHIHLKLAINKMEDREQRMAAQPTSQSKSVTLKMDKFTQLKQTGAKWFSPGFYTSPGGYKVCLAVIPNGDQTGRGTHISVYLCLLPGEHDDLLEWPMRGEFLIELLNQLSDNSHHQKVVHFEDSNAKSTNSQVKSGHGTGLGFNQFIAHSQLDHLFIKYLHNDALFFRLTTLVLHSKSKTWLATTL